MVVSVGAAQSYIEGELGGPTDEEDEVIAVAITATKAADGDPESVALLMINLGNNPVYLFLDQTVSTTKGIYLAANGGSVSMNIKDDFTLPTREWWAVSSGGTSTLLVLRIRRYTTT